MSSNYLLVDYFLYDVSYELIIFGILSTSYRELGHEQISIKNL